MKKLYTFLFLLGSVFANAQTNVSGFINANTNWTMAGSPYIVVGNILVGHSYTLTIDPGVVIKFDSLKAIQIDGELHAVGTAANRIVFTSNSLSPGRGSWTKIQFSDTAVDAQFDAAGNYQSGCIMKYCDVSYGGVNNFGMISIANSSVCISNCRLNYSSYDGIYVNGFAKIDSCSIRNCSHFGIWLLSLNAPYCPYVLEYDSIEYNVTGGIFIFDFPLPSCSYPLVIRKNVFNSNESFGAICEQAGSTTKDKLISENSFLNNHSTNTATISLRSGGNSTIECNLFLNNLVDFSSSAINIIGENDTIRNNVFDHNVSTDQGAVIEIYDNCCFDNLIADNYFVNNVSPVNGTMFLHASNNPPTDASTFKVQHNTFENNYGQSNIHLLIGLVDFSLQFAHISNNNFLSTYTQYVIDNQCVFGGPNIDADSNYWNSTSTQHVDSMINDYFDDGNRSVVFYSPILSSPMDIDTSCAPEAPVSVKEISKEENHLLIYPNPTHNILNVECTIHDAELKMYDMTGRIVLEQQLRSPLSTVNCPLSTGIYLVRVEAADKVWEQKVVIE